MKSTLLELSLGLRSGSTSPSQAVVEALRRVEEMEPAVRAWVTLDIDGALQQAWELERSSSSRTALWGVPVAIKDLIDVRGLPTACGSPLRGKEPAVADAECVRLLRKSGAIIMGKTVTTEFGYFKPGPTRNPVNLSHTPGGSSSGSAAAVAAGMVPLALGTQTAGSLTRPASYCGVAGFVSAKGQFSTAGVTGLSQSLDSIGLITQTVDDLRFTMEALSGLGATSESSKPQTGPVEILLWNGSELGELSKEMHDALKTTGSILFERKKEFIVSNWSDHKMLQVLTHQHHVIMASEASQERRDEMNHLDDLSAPLVELLLYGSTLSELEYNAALARIAAYKDTVLALFNRFDVVLGPAALGAAPAGLEATGSPVLSRPWQALGLPVLTIPGLRGAHGMPLGLQLIGAPGRERRLFDLGVRIEELLSAGGVGH